MMRFAEHITPEGNGSARAIGFEHQQPLQIRMNPFVAGRSRAPIFEARIYLGERAISIGRPNLFTPEALDVVIRGTRGALGELRAVAELAFFAAASGGASQIGPTHILRALESRIGYNEEVVGTDETIHGSEIDAETMIQAPSGSSPNSPIIPDVVQPPVSETIGISQSADAAGDAPLQSTDAADDEPLQHTQAESASIWSGRGGPSAGMGRRIAYAASITAVLLVSFAVAGLVSSQLRNGKSNGVKSVSVPISKPNDFRLAVVAPPSNPVAESSTPAPSSLAPIVAENDPSLGGRDSARAAAAAKVVASKRKRPRVRRRTRSANPVAEQVSAEEPAFAEPPSTDGESGAP